MPVIFSENDLFISPENGNDAWTGRLPQPDSTNTDGPLKTIPAALLRLRKMKGMVKSRHGERSTAAFNGRTTVWLREGCYRQHEPLIFQPVDSGPVTFKAYPGEKPVIDGGERITGWDHTTVNGRPCWIADLPEVRAGNRCFNQLFINGQRRRRPRLPRQGLFSMQAVPGLRKPEEDNWMRGGYTRFTSNPGDVKSFTNLQDIEVVYLHFWVEERSKISSFNPLTSEVTMERPSSRTLYASSAAERLADYYLDNVFDALQNPGEWYLDRKQGKLYYIPLPGETPETAEATAPAALQLLVLDGDPEQERFVEHLSFEELTFRHTDWRYPESEDIARPFFGSAAGRGGRAGSPQAANDVPAVVYMQGARYCTMTDCAIEHIGWYGLEISDGCWGIRIVGNNISDMGAGGIKINGAAATGPPRRRSANHQITDNHIHAGGRVFHCGVGILAMHTHSCDLSHNHIHDLYYTAISCGWVWGYQESVSRDNHIEKNHIHDLGQGLLSDMGGIYILGVQPGTVIRGNLIHDIEMAHYGGWCIYPDEGSSHLVIENNICFRTNDNIFHQHYGRENMVRNNIFAFAENAILAHSRINPYARSISFERNIIITDGSPIFRGGENMPVELPCQLKHRNHSSDLNIIFDLHEKPLIFTGGAPGSEVDLTEWRNLGHDLHSLFQNPEFKDPLNGDFTLKPDSPAWKTGFKPIDYSDVGPRKGNKR